MDNSIFKKNIYILTLCFFNSIAFGVEFEEEDLSSNSASVYSVSDKFNNESKEIELKVKKSLTELMNQYCSEEIRIFCPANVEAYSCLKTNYRLITGQCKNLISKEFGRGISYGRLNLHDLKLTTDAILLRTEMKKNYSLTTYRSKNAFNYRGLDFRKGKLQTRNYTDLNYSGQYVIYSALPKTIFKDEAGIVYNPKFQKTPFFFDEKGRVTVGSLGQDYEYKTHIYLQKGTVVAFDKNRKLVRGILKSTVRYNRCQLLRGQEVSEKTFEKCEN